MISWSSVGDREPVEYTCGYCNKLVGTSKCYFTSTGSSERIYICPHCGCPTFIARDGSRFPGSAYGEVVEDLPDDIRTLYTEARYCFSVNGFTASVLCCRKLLMNISVAKGAKEGLKFIQYIDYLLDNNYISLEAKEWVDHIRHKGNEATHEIVVMSREDAEDLLNFTEMLLKLLFEFPAKIRKRIGSNPR